MFTLTISCLTSSNLPLFIDLKFRVPMQYCSLQHRTLLPSPVTSTSGCCFCFGSVSSFFLKLFLHWSLVEVRGKIIFEPSSETLESFSCNTFSPLAFDFIFKIKALDRHRFLRGRNLLLFRRWKANLSGFCSSAYVQLLGIALLLPHWVPLPKFFVFFRAEVILQKAELWIVHSVLCNRKFCDDLNVLYLHQPMD